MTTDSYFRDKNGQARLMIEIQQGKESSMKRMLEMIFMASVLSVLTFCQNNREWRDSFPVNKQNLGPTGNNRFLLLQPGYRLCYADGSDTLTVTVLAETYIIDRVETRVVLDSEKVDGQIVEVTRDYFAIDTSTKDVYYFGEDVDDYENGRVVGHGGAWLSGVNGAKFGLIMPGTAKVGDRYYQELAPDVAMDRAEIVAIDETVESPAGTYRNCVHTEETTPLESGTSHKRYAPDVGMVEDEGFLLIRVVTP